MLFRYTVEFFEELLPLLVGFGELGRYIFFLVREAAVFLVRFGQLRFEVVDNLERFGVLFVRLLHDTRAFLFDACFEPCDGCRARLALYLRAVSLELFAPCLDALELLLEGFFLVIRERFWNTLFELVDAFGQVFELLVQLAALGFRDFLVFVNAVAVFFRSGDPQEVFQAFEMVFLDDFAVADVAADMEEHAAAVFGLHRLGEVAEDGRHEDALRVSAAGVLHERAIGLFHGRHAVVAVVCDVPAEFLRGAAALLLPHLVKVFLEGRDATVFELDLHFRDVVQLVRAGGLRREILLARLGLVRQEPENRVRDRRLARAVIAVDGGILSLKVIRRVLDGTEVFEAQGQNFHWCFSFFHGIILSDVLLV